MGAIKSKIKIKKIPIVWEITQEDVCSPRTLRPNRMPYGIYECLGRILPIDIGRRVYLRDGIWQAESIEQMKHRTKGGKKCVTNAKR